MARSTLPCPLGGHLSNRQLGELRAMLEEQRAFRVDQLGDLRDPTAALAGSDPEITRSLISAAGEALRDIEDALARMDAGHYGSCVACRGPVEIERLEILPQVARCMACQRG
jgi:RNA polymerase-binding transcription factor DksA